MADIDFSAVLDGMVAGSGGSDPIKSIYNIIPTFDGVQMQILFQAYYFIEKYDLEDMRALFNEFTAHMGSNKSLGFLSSKNLKDLLGAYTQNELVRGIKVSRMSDSADVSQV